MIPSDAAIELLKSFEQGPNGGFAPNPYLCPAGHKTVGWGHVIKPGDKFQFPLDAEQADALLRQDLQYFSEKIQDYLRVPVTQSMFDALCCFAFNLGLGAVAGSTLLWMINRGDYAGAADELLRWNKARNPKTGKKEPLPGLTRRRQAERELFLRDGFPS